MPSQKHPMESRIQGTKKEKEPHQRYGKEGLKTKNGGRELAREEKEGMKLATRGKNMILTILQKSWCSWRAITGKREVSRQVRKDATHRLGKTRGEKRVQV